MHRHNLGEYDIQTILNEMREAYWNALAEQEEQIGEILECLVFTLGGKTFAFETQFASEVIRIPNLIRVPKAQGIVAGIFNLRGEITAAMDIRPLLGLPQPPFSAAGRVMVVKGASFATGILVEAALGVQGHSFENFEPAHPSDAGGDFIRGEFKTAERPVILMDLAALLAAPEMLIGES